MNLLEITPKIISIVEEYEARGGITKNEACRSLMEKHGGSRSTYWKAFTYLLSSKGGDRIESRVVHPNKQQKRLFPTESNKKLNKFKNKMKHVGLILDLVEKYRLVGDCYINNIKNKKITYFSTKFTIDSRQQVDSVTVTDDEKYLGVYTIQARHDLVEKLPLFLYDYIYDPVNELSEIKKECLEICNPFIERCLELLQSDYAHSPFFSSIWRDECKSNTYIWNGKGQAIPNLESEFLKILGRYYFLISKDLSPNFKIDSCDEQKIVSNFTSAFYPRNKLLREFDPIPPYKKKMNKSNSIDTNKILLKLDVDTIHEYFMKTTDENRTKIMMRCNPKDANDPFDTTRGHFLMHGFADDNFNDPSGIVEYYLYWIIELDIFSSLELYIVRFAFMLGVTQNMIEEFEPNYNIKQLSQLIRNINKCYY